MNELNKPVGNVKKDPVEQARIQAEADQYGLKLDTRKSFVNQLTEVAKAKAEKEAAEEAEKAAADANPASWNWKEGYRFKFDGPNGGLYINDKKKGLEFFCPAEDVSNYLED
jgi:hypothetical protein